MKLQENGCSPIQSICWFCKKKYSNENLIPISSMKIKINEILGLEVKDYDQNSEMCSGCVITMNQMYDNRIRMRSSFYNIKARSYFIEGNRDMVKECLSQTTNESPPKPVSVSPTKSFINANSENGLKITEVRSAILDFNAEDESFNEEQDSSSFIKDVTTNELIRPLGKEYSVRLKNDRSIPTTLLKCNECPKTYKSQYYYKKHMLNHKRKRAASQVGKKNYNCIECKQLFTKPSDLREHRKTHTQSYNCNTCSRKFDVLFDFEWHSAECDGIKNALNGTRRRTRSEVSLKINENDYESCGESSVSDSVYSIKQKRLKLFINDRKNIDQIQPNDEQENITEDYDDDNLSNYSFNTNFTSVSEKNYSYNKDISQKLAKLNAEFFGNNEIPDKIIFKKRNNTIYSLSRIDEFECDDCSQRFKTLTGIMEHEIHKHNVLPLYICYECDTLYTHPYYLGMHEFSHNKSVQCHICYESCVTTFELKLHVNRHLKELFNCYICHQHFYRKSDLDQHFLTKFHSISLKCKVQYKKIKNNQPNRNKKYKTSCLIQKSISETNLEYELNKNENILRNNVHFKCKLYDGKNENDQQILAILERVYPMKFLKHYRWFHLRNYFRDEVLQRKLNREHLFNNLLHYTDDNFNYNYDDNNISSSDLNIDLFQVEDNCDLEYENHDENKNVVEFDGIPRYTNLKSIFCLVDEEYINIVYDDDIYGDYNEYEFYR